MVSDNKIKRTDRKEKLLNRQFTQETVIKCKLQSHLKLPNIEKNKFIDIIKDSVLNYSNRIYNATILLNFIIKDIFSNCNNLETLDITTIPDFLDTTFLRQLMLGTKACNKIKFDASKYIKEYPELLYDVNKRTLADRNIYSAGAILLSTNIKNHLVLNFTKVCKKYVYSLESITKNEKNYIINNICAIKLPVKDLEDTERCIPIINHLRNLLNISNTDLITETWLKQNYKIILKFFGYVLLHLENKINSFKNTYNIYTNTEIQDFIKNKESNSIEYKDYKKYSKVSVFNILPIARIKTHFIRIDNSVLQGLVKSSGLKDSKWFEWNNLLDIKNLSKESKNKNKPTGTIETDGNVINIHFERMFLEKKTRKPKTQNSNTEILENDRVIGVDPGRTNIFYGVEEIEPKKYQKYKLTRRQYYQETGSKKATNKSNNWNSNIQGTLDEMTLHSPKTMDLNKFKEFIKVSMRNREILFNEYTKTKWSQQRFRLYSNKKKTISKFFNKIQGKNKRRIVIGYGSASFAPGGKGEMSVPTTSIFKECRYRFKTNVIDEFRTSKINYKTRELLQLVGKRIEVSGKKKLIPVRGLLWCCSTKFNNFIDRDFNAAVNILNLTKDSKRPEIFCRKKEKLPKQKYCKIISS